MKHTKYVLEQMKKENIDEQWKAFCESDRDVIIYGAGRQARIVIDFCNMFCKKYSCLMTTDSRKRWGLVPREDELMLYLIDEFPKEYDKNQYDVIVAMNSEYNDEIKELLDKKGFYNVYAIKDWAVTNEQIRERYYYHYFKFYGARFLTDEKNEQYLEYDCSNGIFRMYYPRDPVFRANVIGELGNIVMPSLFGDTSVCCLGPYEYGEQIQLKKNDVVLDLGANVGLFSCVAAAKGCKVYAFEPDQIPVFDYLKMNASLNPTIEIIPYAVGDRDGETDYYYNDHLETDYDMCQSSIHAELNPIYKKIKVNMITLDSFVKKNDIQRVDFIKSHIEYAERDMLIGAQNILREYAPILSFYSQKALGNERYKEVESLILQANPRYKISYHKRRVYAYV